MNKFLWLFEEPEIETNESAVSIYGLSNKFGTRIEGHRYSTQKYAR